MHGTARPWAREWRTACFGADRATRTTTAGWDRSHPYERKRQSTKKNGRVTVVTFPSSAALSTGDVGVKGSTCRRFRLPKVRRDISFCLFPPPVPEPLRRDVLFDRLVGDLAHRRIKRLSSTRHNAHKKSSYSTGVNSLNRTEPNRIRTEFEPNRTE